MIKRFISLISLIILTTISTAFAEFSDVDTNTDYQTAIEWMNSNGVINGYSDETFRPDKCVNRVEFLKMLYRTLAIDPSQSIADLFSDTYLGQWYTPYVRTARERGTINGYPDGTFRPEQCVNRVEAIKMAVLEFNNGKSPLATDVESPQTITAIDVIESEWYAKYTNYVLAANLVGLEHTVRATYTDLGVVKFFPDEPMTRKEVAEMLYRMKTVKDYNLNSYDESFSPNIIIRKSAEVELTIDQIILTEMNGEKDGNIFEFDLYIYRPDLGLNEDIEYLDEMPLTVDLAIPLQPNLMYVSGVDDTDPNSGSMCDRPRFPHRCSVTIPDDELGKESYTYLIKITFEDGSYASQEVTVPYPKTIEKPEIIEPTQNPAQDSTLDLKFKDIEATYYEVIVDLCTYYNNDGINPCLDSTVYTLKKDENNDLKETFPSEYNIPDISIENGIVHITSDVVMQHDESVNYMVNATLESEIENIPALTKNSDLKTFQVE